MPGHPENPQPIRPRCGSCRHWSEVVAHVEDGVTKALCLNALSPRSNVYTARLNTCPKHETGLPVDLDMVPPRFRAESEEYRRQMIAEDALG